MTGASDVDLYLAALPDGPRAILDGLRMTIRARAPDAVERIAYGMPAFYDAGGFLVSYACFKAHCSLFPASDRVIEALGGELAPYLSGKGTIRFRVDDPLPTSLVERFVDVRVEENADRARRG